MIIFELTRGEVKANIYWKGFLFYMVDLGLTVEEQGDKVREQGIG